jgi:hypothetical protein
MAKAKRLLLPPFDKLAFFEDLGYEPHPGQLQVHVSRKKRRVVASGTRWGKSTCAAWEVIAGLIEPRESTRGRLVAPVYELTERVWRQVVRAFTEKLSHRVVELREREQRLVVVNLAGGRSELQAKSADKPAGLLGESLDFVVVDEAARLRDDTWSGYIVPRLIDKDGWSLIASTPRGPGWFWQEYKRGRKNRDPDCESWAMPSATNPFVSAAVIEAERKRLPEESFKQEFEARFLGVEAEPCEDCGGPSEDNSDWIELPLNHRPESLPRCGTCGMFVDANGRCIVSIRSDWYAALQVESEVQQAGVEEEEAEAQSVVWMYSWHRTPEEGPWHREDNAETAFVPPRDRRR